MPTETRMVPDPSSPTGYSLQQVYRPPTPAEQAREALSQVGNALGGLYLRQVGRQVALTGRYLAEGAADVAGIVTNPLAAGLAGATGQMESFQPLREVVGQGLTRLGVPEPQGAVEETVGNLSRALAAGGGVAGATRAAVPLATGAVSRGTLTELAAMPGRQLAGATTGEAARMGAEAAGAGPVGQIAASVAGGAVPFIGATQAGRTLAQVAEPEAAPAGSALRPARPSVFDYTEPPMPERPARPAPATYDEALTQVRALEAELDDMTRSGMQLGQTRQLRTRGGPGESWRKEAFPARLTAGRGAIEADLAAARADLERLRPAPAERQNPPGTSEAARAYLDKLGLGNLYELGSTRGAPDLTPPPPMEPVRAKTEPVSQAQQAGYQGRDTGEAQEWMSAARKGLDMSQPARIQRAREQNWQLDRPFYHGSKNENIQAFRPNMSETGEGIFLSDNAFLAGEYSNVNDIMALGDLPEGQTNQAGLYDLVTRGTYKQVDASGQPWWRVNMKQEIAAARAEGFDGVDFNNIADAKFSSMAGTTRVVFDPANIRSINAAFDPDEAGSSNLLAMRRGQRPPGDINAQTKRLLAAIEQQAADAGLQQQPGQATFQRGEPATPEQLARARATRGRPQAPRPMEPVRAETPPPMEPPMPTARRPFFTPDQPDPNAPRSVVGSMMDALSDLYRPGSFVSAMGAGSGQASAPPIRPPELDPLGFRSSALEAAKRLPDRPMPPSEAVALIQKGAGLEGFKGDIKAEIDLLGLRDAFEGRRTVTRQEVEDYIRSNRFELREWKTNRVNDKYDIDDDPDIERGESSFILPSNVSGAETFGAHTNVMGELMHALWSFRTDDADGHTFFVRQLQGDLPQQLRSGRIKVEGGTPPLTQDTKQWTNAGVRALTIKAANEGVDSISFPTGKTSADIQGNDKASQYYDTFVREALDRVAKALGGRVRVGGVGVKREGIIIPPTPPGIGRRRSQGRWGAQFDYETGTWMAINEDGTEFQAGFPSEYDADDWIDGNFSIEPTVKTAYILDLTPAMRAKIRREGLPMLGIAAPAAGLGIAAAQGERERVD